MDINYIEENIMSKYWKTLIRKNVTNIVNNKLIKKPYLENYIIELSILDNSSLIDKILKLFELNKITNEEIFLFINNNIDLSIDQKKNIEKFILGNISENFNKIAIEIIIYQIKYFKFYQMITELLFNSDVENNELYNFILIYIKNNKNEIKNYIKNNTNFNIFYVYINGLLLMFEDIFNLLINLELIENVYEKKDILNIFLKNLFNNWYVIYKKDILEDKVNEKIKDYVIKRNIISRILCLPNI